MKILIWLDDTRDPNTNDWLVFSPIDRPFDVIWIKSYKGFIDWITSNGLPDGICFDHDLGLDDVIEGRISKRALKRSRKLPEYKTGYDAAKWLVNYCIDHSLKLPLYNIQSANPVGKENIDKLFINFNKQTI